MPQEMVLVLLVRDGCLYLGLKKLKIGAGMLMPPGGKMEAVDQNNPRLTAVREVRQESGIRIKPEYLKQVALLHIGRKRKKDHIRLHVYMTERFSGQFKETAELGELQPYSFSKVDYNKLMPADRIWLSDVLSGLTLEAWFTYNNKRTQVLDYRSRIRFFE